MKKRKVNYIITQEFKTSKPNLTEQELKNIFNKNISNVLWSKKKIFLIRQILKIKIEWLLV